MKTILMCCFIWIICILDIQAQMLKVADLKTGKYVLANNGYFTGTRSEALRIFSTQCQQPVDSLFMFVCSKTITTLFTQQVSSSGCWFRVAETSLGPIDACRLSDSIIIIDYGSWTELVRAPF